MQTYLNAPHLCFGALLLYGDFLFKLYTLNYSATAAINVSLNAYNNTKPFPCPKSYYREKPSTKTQLRRATIC